MTCSQSEIDLYNKIISGEVDPKSRFVYGRNALFYVQNLKDFNFLLRNGLNPYEEDSFGSTAIEAYYFRQYSGTADRLQLSAELTYAFDTIRKDRKVVDMIIDFFNQDGSVTVDYSGKEM